MTSLRAGHLNLCKDLSLPIYRRSLASPACGKRMEGSDD